MAKTWSSERTNTCTIAPGEGSAIAAIAIDGLVSFELTKGFLWFYNTSGSLIPQ